MISIQLNNLKFFAYHGLYKREKMEGNHFELNINIHYQPKSKRIDHINDTINYEDVFATIKNRMEIATPLLETVAMDIANELLTKFQLVEFVFVSITKINPPIEGFEGNVSVCYEKERD